MTHDGIAYASLLKEHLALQSQYGAVQRRCSMIVATQAAEIERLREEAMRLRAAAIVRETALEFERADRVAIEARIPGLPRRAALARKVEQLAERVQSLTRERGAGRLRKPDTVAEEAALEASLVAADLVICQTGCISHGAYWKVRDYCKRTGKQCVLVDQPQVATLVRGMDGRAPYVPLKAAAALAVFGEPASAQQD